VSSGSDGEPKAAATTDLLDRFATAWCAWDFDGFAGLYAPGARSYDDPFEPPLVGREAIRANHVGLSAIEEGAWFAFERSWSVHSTILAAWRAGYVHRSTREQVVLVGFATFDLDAGGLIDEARFWYNRHSSAA
jgi:hypothetical protein